LIEVRVPDEQEGTKAVVRAWLKQIGDAVAENDPLVELETDKVTQEVPAPAAGVLAEIVLDDLLLQWYTIEPGSVCIGKSIRELQVRTATGASIVSIIEPDRVKRINPEADTVLNEGATLIMAGDRMTIARLKRLLVTGRVD